MPRNSGLLSLLACLAMWSLSLLFYSLSEPHLLGVGHPPSLGLVSGCSAEEDCQQNVNPL